MTEGGGQAPMRDEMRRRPWWVRLRAILGSETVAVLLEYTLAAIVATWPAVLYMRSAVIGDPYSDMWKHLWGLWWYHDAVVGHHQIPLFTTAINHPTGGYLYFADPLSACLSIPLQICFSLVFTYNLLILMQLVGGCWGAFCLARETGLQRPAAFVAGLVYGLSPYVLSYSVGSGVTETINLIWPPLYLAWMIRVLRGEGRRAQVVAGIMLFVAGFSCWYYSEFLLLFTAFFVLFGPHVTREVSRTWIESAIVRVERAAPAVLVAFCLILPFATTFGETLKNPYNLITPDKHMVPGTAPVERTVATVRDYLGEDQLNYTGLQDFFLVGKSNATATLSMDRLTRVYYLGFLATGVILLGLIVQPRPWGGALHFWLWITIGLAFLSLGPNLHWSSAVGATTRFCTSWPYKLVYYGFPLFKQIGQPFRLMLLVYLGEGILLGMVLQSLQGRFGLARNSWWLVGVGVLLETLYLSPLPYPMPLASAQIHPFYTQLAQDASTDAVWDVPGERPGSRLQAGEYYFYQTVHHHPIPYRTSGEASYYIRATGFHRMVSALLHGDWENREAGSTIAASLGDLKAMHVRYVVIHREVFGPRLCSTLLDVLRPVLGAPVLDDTELVVFKLY